MEVAKDPDNIREQTLTRLVEQVQTALGVAQSTVSARLKRARAGLRVQLEGGHSHG